MGASLDRNGCLSLTSLVLAASFATAEPALATCNFGGDAKNISSLDFGTLGLSWFSPGSLRIVAQQASSESDVWRFSLRPHSMAMQVKLASEGNTVLASMRLTRPITGIVREIIESGNCRRSIWIDDGALEGNTLTFNQGTVQGNIRGSFVLTKQTFSILKNIGVGSKEGLTSGILHLKGRHLVIENSIISVPGMGEAAGKLQSTGNLDFRLTLATLRATLVNATMAATRPRFAGPTALSLHGLHLTADNVVCRKAVLTLSSAGNTLALRDLRLASAHLSYDGIGTVVADNLAQLLISEIRGPVTMRSGTPILRIADSTILGADAPANNIKVTNQSSEPLVSGAGEIKLKKLTRGYISAALAINEPSTTALETAAFSSSIKRVNLAVTGPRDDPAFTVAGRLSSLVLGSLRISAPSIPFTITRPTGGLASAYLKSPSADADIALGKISGKLSNLELSGDLSGFSNLAAAKFVVPIGAFNAKLELRPIQIAVFGGELKADARAINVKNKDELSFGTTVSAELSFGESKLALIGIKLSPEEGVSALAVQDRVSYSDAHSKIGVTLAPEAAFPLLIIAHFDIPGFSLTFPFIPVELGSLEVEFNSIKVSKFTIDIWGTSAALSLHELNLGVGEFRPRKLRPGETKVATNLRGRASTPFSIAKLSGFFELLPLPPAFSELALYDLHFSAEQVKYTDTTGLDVSTAQADIAVPHAWMPLEHRPPHNDPFISVVLSASKSNIGWHGRPNGTADVDRLKIDLRGQPSHINGSVSLFASTIALSGRADIRLSTKPDGNHGCELLVPTNVGFSMFDVDGNVDVLDGKPVGTIKVDKFNLGRIHYWGHKDCRWSQQAKIKVIPYPCGFSWFGPTYCDEIKFDIGWVFSVQAINMHVRPSVIEFKVGGDGKFEACKYSLAQLVPIVPPVFSIAPQLPRSFRGEIARFFNDMVRISFTQMYTLLSSGAMNLYSAMSLIDFASHGRGLNFRSECHG